jgi:hypothetical protein
MEIEPKHLGIAGIVVILIASVVYLNMGSGVSKKAEGSANNEKKKATAEDSSKSEKVRHLRSLATCLTCFKLAEISCRTDEGVFWLSDRNGRRIREDNHGGRQTER